MKVGHEQDPALKRKGRTDQTSSAVCNVMGALFILNLGFPVPCLLLHDNLNKVGDSISSEHHVSLLVLITAQLLQLLHTFLKRSLLLLLFVKRSLLLHKPSLKLIQACNLLLGYKQSMVEAPKTRLSKVYKPFVMNQFRSSYFSVIPVEKRLGIFLEQGQSSSVVVYAYPIYSSPVFLAGRNIILNMRLFILSYLMARLSLHGSIGWALRWR